MPGKRVPRLPGGLTPGPGHRQAGERCIAGDPHRTPAAAADVDLFHLQSLDLRL
jgi:hypothetical protein